MNTIVIRALAKINLAIDIKGKRENGYHDIDMITVPLKLHDSLEITPFAETEPYDTYLYCDDPTIVCDESNLVYKTLKKMKDENLIDGNYSMFIHKRIPVQAGLGGGSADAAAVIVGLDKYAKRKFTQEEKIKLGLSIGSDVPFCIMNKPCRVKGLGEILEPIEIKCPYHVLIVKPTIGLSTKSVYEAYDLIEQSTIRHPNTEALIQALKEDDEKEIQNNLINVLSYPAIQALPLIADLLQRMKTLDLPLSGMSGTGSACFALSKDAKHLELVARVLEKEGYACYVTQFAI